MKRFHPLDALWLRRWTWRFGIAAALTLAVPTLTVVALISVIGIPLGLLMMATPTLFSVVALANVVQRLHRRDGVAAVLASLAVAVAVLAGFAAFCNSLVDRRADSFLAGDVDAIERPLHARAIGLAGRDVFVWNRHQTRCAELCQRLLLSGAAERVLVPATRPDEVEWSAGTPAFSFRLEARGSCPTVQLPGRLSDRTVDDAKPDEAVRLVIAGGRCLVEEPATMGDADAVVTAGRVQRGAGDAGLSPMADTVTVDRATVHVRQDGGLVERFRWTGVTVGRHPFVPVPTLIGGAELRMDPGFWRDRVTRNPRGFATTEGVDAVRFARDELGLDVSVPAMAASRNDVVARALDAQGPVSAATKQVIEDLFESFVQVRGIDEATRRVAFRALADPRVPAPRSTHFLVSACAREDAAVNVELADILFRRLMTTDPALLDDDPGYRGHPASYLANAIALLPPIAVRSHRRELEEIARDSARRRCASRALSQLAAFGPDAVPALLHLVDTGCALKASDDGGRPRERDEREDWRNVYRTGLAGLCRVGPAATAALPPLLERLREGSLPIDGANRALALSTLVRLGADPETLRGKLASDPSPEGGPDFDRDVKRARAETQCGP